jgi:hypothetical protein
MATIATLTVDLVAQTAKFNTNLAKATKKSDTWAVQTRKAVNVAGKAFAALALTAAVGLGAVYAQTAKAGDAVAKFSDTVGEAPERVYGLHHAMELTGVAIEAGNTALEQMVRRTSDAAQGAGEARHAIKELGLDARKLAEMSPADQFTELADAMKGVENQSDRVRLAYDLFGRSGVDMLNTLDLGKNGLADMDAEAEALGISLNRIQLAKLEMANDAMTRMRSTSKGFTNQLAVQMAPIIGGVANALTNAAKEAGGFGSIAERVVAAGVKGFGFLANMARGLHIVFLGLRQAVAELMNGLIQFATIGSRMGGKVADWMGIDANALHSINEFADSVKQTTADLAKELREKMMEEMPSEVAARWLEQNAALFDKAAADVAERSKARMGGALAVPPVDEEAVRKDNQKIIDLQQEKFQRLHEQAMQAQGRTLELELERREREKAELEASRQRMEEAGILTAEMKEQFRKAEEDAEIIHQQKLADIREQALNHEREIAKAKWQIAEDVMGIGAALSKEGSRAHRVMLAGARTAALMQSRIALQAAIAEANRASPWTAKIPAIASATSIGAGAIANLKGMNTPSFDGGGYTGSGSRSGGLDGKGGFMAMLHPRETVIDHTKGGGAKGLRVVIINQGQPMQPTVSMTSEEEVRIVLKAMDNKLQQDLHDGRGVWAQAQRKYGWATRGAI